MDHAQASPEFGMSYYDCRFRKNPRKRRFELCNILISQCPNARLLTFYEAIIIGYGPTTMGPASSTLNTLQLTLGHLGLRLHRKNLDVALPRPRFYTDVRTRNRPDSEPHLSRRLAAKPFFPTTNGGEQ
jgi:hypothetical protein